MEIRRPTANNAILRLSEGRTPPTANRQPPTRKGSALVFALILVVAITSVLLATQEVSMAAVRGQRNLESSLRARYIKESCVAYYMSKFKAGTLSLPTADTVTVNGTVCTASTSDPGNRQMQLDLSFTSDQKSYSQRLFGGQRIDSSPWFYSLFVGSNMVLTSNLTTGAAGVNGDVYIQNAVLAGGITRLTANGDVESPTAISAARYTVSGTTWPSAPAIPALSASHTDYNNAPDVTFNSNVTLSGYTFGGGYPLIYCNKDLTLNNGLNPIVFRGKGVIFVKKDAHIQGNVQLFDANSKVAIIVQGDLSFESGSSYNGFFFTNGNATVWAGGAKAINSGSLVCNRLFVLSTFSIQHDTYFWDTPSEAVNFKLPGFWP